MCVAWGRRLNISGSKGAARGFICIKGQGHKYLFLSLILVPIDVT